MKRVQKIPLEIPVSGKKDALMLTSMFGRRDISALQLTYLRGMTSAAFVINAKLEAQTNSDAANKSILDDRGSFIDRPIVMSITAKVISGYSNKASIKARLPIAPPHPNHIAITSICTPETLNKILRGDKALDALYNVTSMMELEYRKSPSVGIKAIILLYNLKLFAEEAIRLQQRRPSRPSASSACISSAPDTV